MIFSINFYDQFFLQTDKIHNHIIDYMFSSEFIAI